MKIPFFGKKRRPENEAVIDLGKLKEIDTRNRLLKANPLNASSSAPGPASTDMDFLGALAASATSTETPSAESSPSPGFNTPIASSSQSIDPERFERLHRRIDHVIQRMELIERKIDRIEHRVDLKY